MAAERPDIMTGNGEAREEHDHPQWLKDRLEWFQDLKFGLFMHWGIYSQWGCTESWPLVADAPWARPEGLPAWVERGKDLERFRRDYRALNTTFNPQHFEPEAWAALAQSAGMKYVAFTTKHHDGFCMFDTKTTDYRITHPSCPFHTNPRANVAKEVFDAFRAQDFAISCYFSKSDWHSPYYWNPDRPAPDRHVNYDTQAEPERWEKFVQYVHAQVKELMTGYGPIDVLWLDGGQVRPPKQDIRMAEMAAMARERQRGLIIADRTVHGPYENILTPEQKIPPEPLAQPWESCLTMGTSWSYKPNDEYKSVRQLIHMLADIVCKGGNFLLNVGPDADGRFVPEAVERLRAIGDWMSVNAEAIHGTRTVTPYKEGNVCFTRKGDKAYAIVLAEEGKNVPPRTVTLKGIRPASGSDVHLLGVSAPVQWTTEGAAAQIIMPTNALPCEHAWVLEFAPHGGGQA